MYLVHRVSASQAMSHGIHQRFDICLLLVLTVFNLIYHSPSIGVCHFIRGSTHPACLAIPAAAELLTPALQKNTTSLPLGGFWNPKRSSKSSSLRSSASGCDVTGMLMEVGIVLASNSWGSRTSMSSRESEGCSRM